MKVAPIIVVLPIALALAGILMAQGKDMTVQQYAVLRTDQITVSSELGTHESGQCKIFGIGNSADMRCNSDSGTSKTYRHYNTALVVDQKGVAYVISCKSSLISKWCKQLMSGTTIQGSVSSGKLSVADGAKTRSYDVLTSEYVGLPHPATGNATTPPAGGDATHPRSETTSTQPAATYATLDQAAPPPSGSTEGSSTPCSSDRGTCAMFISQPEGADILVDEKFVGNTPSMILLSPGSHSISIEAKGRKPWLRTMVATAGSRVTVQANLETDTPNQ